MLRCRRWILPRRRRQRWQRRWRQSRQRRRRERRQWWRRQRRTALHWRDRPRPRRVGLLQWRLRQRLWSKVRRVLHPGGLRLPQPGEVRRCPCRWVWGCPRPGGGSRIRRGCLLFGHYRRCHDGRCHGRRRLCGRCRCGCCCSSSCCSWRRHRRRCWMLGAGSLQLHYHQPGPVRKEQPPLPVRQLVADSLWRGSGGAASALRACDASSSQHSGMGSSRPVPFARSPIPAS